MTRFIPLLLLAVLPATAEAGFGSTIGMGSLDIQLNGPNFGVRNTSFLPTLDYRSAPLHLQFHVLDLVDQLADEEVYLGANIYYEVHRTDVSGDWNAVVQPGGSIDIYGDPFILGLMAETRLGVELEGSAGFGVHVVPAAGIIVGDDDSEFAVGGALQVGVWF